MEGKGKVVCIIAGVLAIISAVLGFVAEATKVKGSDISVDVMRDECVYPGSPAAVVGFISAIALLAAFVVINSAGGCFCCFRDNRCHCNVALVCFIFSWLTFVPGLLLLLGGASLSTSGSRSMVRVQGTGSTAFYRCSYLRPGVFSSAACLSLISISLAIAYYRNLSLASPASAHNIQLAQPNVPPPPKPYV